jgi:dihydropteroate synthase
MLGKPISVDTQKTAVMREVLALGVDIINDVRALQADGAVDLLAQHPHTQICLMHMQGQPQTMQAFPIYENVVEEVYGFLKTRIDACEQAGIDKTRLIIDPGFGFGKTLSHNLTLLGSLEHFHDLGCPILVGLSRKSMFGEITGKPFDQRMASSLAAAVVSLLQGVSIIRTHDIAPTRDALSVLVSLKQELT